MLIAMFLFSFVGGLISPYQEDQQFYTYTYMDQEYVGVVKNKDFRYARGRRAEVWLAEQAQFLLAQMKGKESFDYKDVTYEVAAQGEDLYTITSGGADVAIAYKDIGQRRRR